MIPTRLAHTAPHALLRTLLISMITCVSCCRALAQLSFSTPADYPVGNAPGKMATGFFNGDDAPDLVVVNTQSDNVSVLINNGEGTFHLSANYGVHSLPLGVAAGDFNGDGKQDLAVANYGSSDISILVGNGNGTFQPRMDFPAGLNPPCVAVADFNRDGKQDLVAGSNSFGNSHNIFVLLGKGDATFKAPMDYAAGPEAAFVAVGDFNADGKLDLAVADSYADSISVLTGNGHGSFKPPVPYTAGFNNVDLAISDFNGDGIQDIVTANHDIASATLLLGNGDGTFRLRGNYAAGNSPLSLAVSDFNFDGLRDVAIANNITNPAGTLNVLLGNGQNGSFGDASSYESHGAPTSVVAADFDRKGALDLAVSHYSTGNVSILLNTTTGTECVDQFQPSSSGVDLVPQVLIRHIRQSPSTGKLIARLAITQSGSNSTVAVPSQSVEASLVRDPTACAPAVADDTLQIESGKLSRSNGPQPVYKTIKLKYAGVIQGLYLRIVIDATNGIIESNEHNNTLLIGPL